MNKIDRLKGHELINSAPNPELTRALIGAIISTAQYQIALRPSPDGRIFVNTTSGLDLGFLESGNNQLEIKCTASGILSGYFIISWTDFQGQLTYRIEHSSNILMDYRVFPSVKDLIKSPALISFLEEFGA